MTFKLKNGFSAGGVLNRTLIDSNDLNALLPNSNLDSDERWMAFALLEAMNGVGWASPNPAVGCVVVDGDRIITRGFTQAYGGKHAERMAFESLMANHSLNSFRNLKAYVTLEPCTHHGKQPPCVELLLNDAVEEVIIGCADPDSRVSGRGIKLLEEAGKKVRVGVLGAEARSWHLPFLHHREKKKVLWVAKWAENQDGLLADAQGNSKWITNSQSRSYTHWLRQKYDAILVGAGTWIQDQPKLNVRDCALPHRRNPLILIHDPRSRVNPSSLPEGAKLFQQQTVAELVQAVDSTDFGFELQSVFCEGGAHTLNELFKLGRIDLVHRFIGQKDFGASGKMSNHRVNEFSPESNSNWVCTTLCNLEYDCLQEWVNCT